MPIDLDSRLRPHLVGGPGVYVERRASPRVRVREHGCAAGKLGELDLDAVGYLEAVAGPVGLGAAKVAIVEVDVVVDADDRHVGVGRCGYQAEGRQHEDREALLHGSTSVLSSVASSSSRAWASAPTKPAPSARR